MDGSRRESKPGYPGPMIPTRLRAAFALAIAASVVACGPWGPMGVAPGGPLVGPDATRAAAESCDDATLLAALETRSGWLRHSITVFCIAHDGVVYVPSRGGGEKRWTANVLADPRVRLELGGAIHEGRLTRVRQVDPALARAFVRKVAGVEVESARFLLDAPAEGDDRADVWLFRFDEDGA